MDTATLPRLSCLGEELDTSPESFGEMRDSSAIAHDFDALRERMDEEGYLFLTDRRDYVINVGGVNIYPQEAENLLAAHPKVLDVAMMLWCTQPAYLGALANGTHRYSLDGQPVSEISDEARAEAKIAAPSGRARSASWWSSCCSARGPAPTSSR